MHLSLTQIIKISALEVLVYGFSIHPIRLQGQKHPGYVKVIY